VNPRNHLTNNRCIANGPGDRARTALRAPQSMYDVRFRCLILCVAGGGGGWFLDIDGCTGSTCTPGGATNRRQAISVGDCGPLLQPPKSMGQGRPPERRRSGDRGARRCTHRCRTRAPAPRRGVDWVSSPQVERDPPDYRQCTGLRASTRSERLEAVSRQHLAHV
jgi:hypothetical protein